MLHFSSDILLILLPEILFYFLTVFISVRIMQILIHFYWHYKIEKEKKVRLVVINFT